MKFDFIHAEKAHFPIAVLCRIMRVTRGGYYAYARRSPTKRQQNDERLRTLVLSAFTKSKKRYGSPRIQEQLRRDHVRVGKTRLVRIMQSLGLRAQRSARRTTTTKAEATHTVANNVLDRDFVATKPMQKWVTDITYIWTGQGWAYLAVILDLFSRAVVVWSLDATLATDLPMRALRNAIHRSHGAAPTLHHSDRGCQYTSQIYLSELESLGVVISMSRKGNCWDNAVAESFFSSLKCELLHHEFFHDRATLRSAVFEYIEVFYNRQRLHSSLDYKTPAEVEDDFISAKAA